MGVMNDNLWTVVGPLLFLAEYQLIYRSHILFRVCSYDLLSCDCSPGAAPPGGVGVTTYPPLLRYVPRRGYNAIYVLHLRGTTVYSWPQKLRNSHLALALRNSASCTVCYNNDTENLTYSLAS